MRPARSVVQASLAAFLAYAAPHFLFHVAHLERLDAAEVIAQIVLLGSFVAVPAVLLVLTRAEG